MEYALTGEAMSATEAEQWGIVNVLTEPGLAVEGAMEFEARLCKNAPLAVSASRKVLLEGMLLPDVAAFQVSLNAVGRCTRPRTSSKATGLHREA